MIVFDAGALVALERDNRAIWTSLREAVRADVPVVVPVAALAQAWRGGPRQARLARAVADLDRASFDDMALRVGDLCGTARVADVVDASVALVAAQPEIALLYTSDPEDLAALVRHAGRRRGPKIVTC